MTLSGIALSGVAMISCSTVAALSMRFSISDLSLSELHDQLVRNRSPAPSTATHLGQVQRFLVICRPLLCSSEQLNVFSRELKPRLVILLVPSGAVCKAN